MHQHEISEYANILYMDLLVEIKWREIEKGYSPSKIGSDLR
jgi:hypothetical protein